MRRGRYAVLSAGILLGLIPLVSSAQSTAVIPWRPVAALELEQTVRQILDPDHQYTLHLWTVAKEHAAPASHVRIGYQSQTPLPIRYSPIGAYDVDVLLAVLPPAENGDVTIPLAPSPAWNGWSGGFTIQIYGLEEAPPVIAGVETLNDASFFARIGSYISHPFAREYLDISSSNFLLGYRMGGVALGIILGAVMIAGCSVLLLRGTKPVTALIMVTLSGILVYQVRFLIDEVHNAIADLSEWSAHETYKQMGDSFAMAAFVKERAEDESQPVTVADCGQMTTAMRYYLYPVPVEPISTQTAATFGTLAAPWKEVNGVLYCGTSAFSGTVLHTFDGGGAVVRLSPVY